MKRSRQLAKEIAAIESKTETFDAAEKAIDDTEEILSLLEEEQDDSLLEDLEKELKKAADDVRQGMTLTMAMESYKLFPTMLVQMVSVGEQTGDLESVLSRSCSFFENQAERAISSLTSIIQPIILCIIGASVGILFYAVYSPLLQVMNTLGT